MSPTQRLNSVAERGGAFAKFPCNDRLRFRSWHVDRGAVGIKHLAHGFTVRVGQSSRRGFVFLGGGLSEGFPLGVNFFEEFGVNLGRFFQGVDGLFREGFGNGGVGR